MTARKWIVKNLHWFFFALVVLGTLYMDVWVANWLLDGDASQLMAKGWLIAQQRNLFTTDVYLTTEVCFFDTSAIAAFFFLFIRDWTTVRILTTIVLQAWYVTGFLFLCRQSRVSWPAAVTTAGMMLLPISMSYARSVLYHLYYLQYFGDTFWLLYLIVRLVSTPEDRKQRWLWWLLGAAWFYIGTIGIRYMLIVGIPLILYTFVTVLQKLKSYELNDLQMRHSKGAFWQNDAAWLLKIVMLTVVCFAAGYMIYSQILLPRFQPDDTSSTWFYPEVSAERYADIFMGWLIATGVRSSMLPLVGLRGCSLAASLVLFGCLFGFSAKGLLERSQDPLSARLPRSLFLISFAATTLIFAFETYDEFARFYELYYLPVIVMAFPVLAQELSGLRCRGVSAAKHLICWVTCFCILFQGAYSLYFIRFERNEMDEWSGLWYTEMNTVDQLLDCVDFMQNNGYTHGFIDYWYANTMMEMSDGTLNVAGLEADYVESDSLVIHDWGTFKSAFEPQNLPEKVMVFAKHKDCWLFEKNHPDACLVHEGWYLNGYEVDSSLITIGKERP